MADKTIAISNRGGFWKTRYTFFSSCYSFVDRCLISFNKLFTTQPVWKHDDNQARTSFYGTQGGSGIAVTFNENPSQNKLYKAFSLEATNNVTGISVFRVNNSSVAEQTKNIQAGSIQERGGIMYGHIGRETIALGANTNVVGKILSAVITDLVAVPDPGFLQAITVEYTMSFIDGAQNNMVYSDDFPSKLFTYYVEALDQGAGLTTQYFAPWTTDPLPASAFESYAAMTGAMRPISMNGNVLTLQINFNGADAYNEYVNGGLGLTFPEALVYTDEDGNLPYNFYLYSMSAESINGEDPKGQTADAIITLGSAPYELYALNVEYAPTDLDHSK